MAKRLKAMGQVKYQTDGDPRTSGPGFGVAMHEEELERPLHWREPRTVFVDSMGDLFHSEVLGFMSKTGAPFLAEVFAVMAMAKRHTFQVLTKRPQIMQAVLAEPRFRVDVNAALLRRGVSVMRGGFETPWPPNIWLGVSVESPAYKFRLDWLRRALVAVRFASFEPLLEDLGEVDLNGIDWAIVGGESGSNARPMHPDWARSLRDQCTAAGVPFFFKEERR